MTDYRSLKVWEKAHSVTLSIYRLTAAFPRREKYGLTAQIRRAACSVPSNLAEGCGRRSTKELRQFCSVSLGSANELDYQLMLARDLGYVEGAEYAALVDQVDHVRRMLASFIATIRA